MNPFADMPKERKRLLLIGAVLLAAGAIYRFWPGLIALTDFSADIDLKKRQIVKYQQLAASKPILDKHLLGLTRNLERAETRLFSRSTPALAAVDIQSLINDIFGRTGLQANRTRVLKPVEIEDTPYLQIGVEVNFTASIPQFKQALYRIESADKFLSVRSLRMNIARSRKDEAGSLSIQMVVEGIMPDSAIPAGGDRS